MKQKKHTELGFKSGRAIRKVTGQSRVDWFWLSKKYPLKAREIRRRKDDQEFLKALKSTMEKQNDGNK